jgi:hypothetical protein
MTAVALLLLAFSVVLAQAGREFRRLRRVGRFMDHVNDL